MEPVWLSVPWLAASMRTAPVRRCRMRGLVSASIRRILGVWHHFFRTSTPGAVCFKPVGRCYNEQTASVNAEQPAAEVAPHGMIWAKCHATKLAAWPHGCACGCARHRGCLTQGAREANARVDASVGVRDKNVLHVTYEAHACCKKPCSLLVRPQLQRVPAAGAYPCC